MPSLISSLGAQRVKTMARKTNNELSALPGFFYHPQDSEGLEELSYDQRVELFANQGNYSADLSAYLPGSQERNGDMECALANSRIPTHRRPGTEIPGFGKVPIDLRGVLELK